MTSEIPQHQEPITSPESVPWQEQFAQIMREQQGQPQAEDVQK